MKFTTIGVYELFREKVGEKESRALIEWAEGTVQSQAATKADLLALELRLRKEITKLKPILVGIAILMVATNPKVIEILGKILGII